jgi:GntR family transcriptional regulator
VPDVNPSAPPQPRYHDAFRRLAGRIESGELAAGDRLPSERWLCDQFGVSRTTVRRAIEELVTVGLVEPSGRIAAPTALAHGSNELMSLTDLARARGLTATSDVLSAAVWPATLDEADVFQVGAGTDVFELRRRRLLDGLAVAVDHDRVPLRHLPDAMEIDFTTASLYASLAAAGNRIVRSSMQIEAHAADIGQARLLGLEPGAPVLVSLDHATDASGQVVNVGRTVYRSDRHRFLATFVRKPRAD